MAITEKSVMRTEVLFSDDRQQRYLLRKEWDKSKKKAMVLMISPSYANEILIDMTTLFVINNLYRLDYGVAEIVNLFSAVDGSRNVKHESAEALKANQEQLLSSAAKVDLIIIAWGKAGENSNSIQQRQQNFLELLKPYEEKLYSIGMHPLAPQIRAEWDLRKFSIEEIAEISKTSNVKIFRATE
jgi:hypothetical protein